MLTTDGTFVVRQLSGHESELPEARFGSLCIALHNDPYAQFETMRISGSRIGSQAGVVRFAGNWPRPDMNIVFRRSTRRSRSRISLRAASTAHLTAAPKAKIEPATARTHFCDPFRCLNYA